jgi:Ca2+-binding EF-hand superfamily protein
MSLDKDGDGKISRDELPEQARKAFDHMDTNSDGFIDATEIAELQKKAEAMKRQRGDLPGSGMGPGGSPPPEGSAP